EGRPPRPRRSGSNSRGNSPLIVIGGEDLAAIVAGERHQDFLRQAGPQEAGGAVDEEPVRAPRVEAVDGRAVAAVDGTRPEGRPPAVYERRWSQLGAAH